MAISMRTPRADGEPPADDILDALPVDADEPIWVEPDDAVDALPAADEGAPRRPARQAPLTLWRAVGAALEWVIRLLEWPFGVASLILGLAVLAALPVLGFLSLGYLLEAGGRIARTDPERQRSLSARKRNGLVRPLLGGWLALRAGLSGVRKAARVGGMVVGVALLLLPLQLLSSLYVSAQIIDPHGRAARGWKLTLIALTVFQVMRIALALTRGGRLRYFWLVWLIPNVIWLGRRLPRGGYYAEARDAVWDFVTGLRLPYYWWLGFRGFVGGLVWLAVPVTLLALARQAPLVGFVGGVWLALALLVVPFLQMRFAAENRFRACFELGAVLSRFGRAPWAFAFAAFVTLLFALPLYLLKIEMVPREAAWLPCLFFIVFIWPTRLLAGWAYARGGRREAPRHWSFAATGLALMLPAAGLYVLFLALTQYTSWEGAASLYEQHAFLLPVPFMGW
jgi:hypothetical protein